MSGCGFFEVFIGKHTRKTKFITERKSCDGMKKSRWLRNLHFKFLRMGASILGLSSRTMAKIYNSALKLVTQELK